MPSADSVSDFAMDGDLEFTFTASFNRLCSKYVDKASFVNSPFSVELCLAILHGGAVGSTAAQISRVLGIEKDADSYYQRCHQALLSATNSSGVRTKISSCLYVSKELHIIDVFLHFVAKNYLAQVERIDFGDSNSASTLINRNVGRVTCGKIKDIIDPASLDCEIKAILVNAVYFKGNWNKKFDPANTRPCDFYIDSNRVVKTQMMMMEDVEFNAGCVDDLDCKCIELPYEDTNFQMLILLPHDRDGICRLENRIGTSTLREARKAMSGHRCKLWLPKFTIETEYDLKQVLIEAGVEHLFDECHSDLSRITGRRDLVLSQAVHKAVIEVNEEGTEAAAATAMMLMRCSIPIEPPRFEFKADHPFVFFVIDRQSEVVHFSGRFVGK